MSNLKYLKGVRTRYYNILEKDVNSACSLLKEQYEIDGDKQALLSEVCVHIERLQTYSNKLESQSEKVTAALDGDEEYIEEILREDTELCDSALKLCSELKKCEHHVREELETDKLNQSITDSKSATDENFHKLMEMQLQLQKQVLATSEKTKESGSQIKLPKLEIRSFSGDRLQWIEFWQSFENSIHKNKSLSGLEKFNYLRSKLTGEAKGAIAGLALSNENYQPAVDILKERYGNIQETIDLHYNRIINLKPANDSVESLRYLLDTVNKNLRSLEVLGQNVNQDIFVSVVKTKLPVNVVRHLEIQKGSAIKWTVQMLRDLLTEYVSACEKAEKVKRDSNPKQRISNNTMKTTVDEQNHSTAEALAVNDEDKSKRKFQCRYCAGSHWSDECPKYKTIKERKKCLKGSCYKCLKQGHKFDECKSQKTCVYCKEVNVHHRSLCPKKFKETFNRESAHVAGENNNLVTEQNNEESDEEEALMSSNESVLMQTAQTVITDPLSKKEQKVRILLDSGSQRTYISEQLAKSMDLQRGQEEEIRLVTFGSDKTKVMKTFPTKLNLRFQSGEELAISANVVPNITGTIHRKPVSLVDKKTFKDLTENLVLADNIPKEKEADRVDLLIGNDYYLDLVTGHKIEVQPGLYLLSSKLGWILTGRTQEVDNATKDVSMLIMTHGNNITETEVFTDVDKEIPRKPDLEDFWNWEAIGMSDRLDQTDDHLAMKRFRETLIFKDNRYHVTWPWKTDIPEIPTNRQLATGRLRSLVTRLQARSETMKKYNDIIEDQLDKNIIEKVDLTKSHGILHYIPHHAVIKPDRSTTKVRIVYDASAKSKPENKSLNEMMYRGPVMLHDLCGMLLRFRLHLIGIVAYIEKAFLQVSLQPSERDATRFLWLKNVELPAIDSNIQEFRFCRVPFGVISSPFLLGATVDYHLDSYDSDVARLLKRDIYMDNVITGAKSIEESVLLYDISKRIFSEASMNLREWATSSDELTEAIPTFDRADGGVMKVLGLSWKRLDDTLALRKVDNFVDKSVTKRTVLKRIASVFDPLGLFSPITVRGKLLLQNIWLKKFDWDDQIDESDIETWFLLKEDLHRIADVNIPRCVSIQGANVTSDLLCFCDASKRAYSANIYLIQKAEDKRRSELIFSKTRIAPTSGTTIPRLELMGLLIGVRSLKFVKEQLSLDIRSTRVFTDSQCVLKWVSATKHPNVFVSNRVREIKGYSDVKFHYISSKDNPADISSRGCELSELKDNSLWWHGPEWILDTNCDKDIDNHYIEDTTNETTV